MSKAPAALFRCSILLSLCVWMSTQRLQAQLCQGSLGDPIVNKTFGSGSNPGAPLQAATTAYQYVSNDCPNDGFYTVRSNTNACFGSSWHSLNRDHTGDPNGYFMLVNASIQPSAFYLDTVKGLCGGTTFEFAAWVMNVLLPSACSPNPIQPNLTFTIEKTDGTVLQTYNTNNISSQSTPTWQQFGFFFTTPSNVSDIVLRIFNNSQGGCGNDLALDDITFRPCGPQLQPTLNGLPDTTASLCEGIARSFALDCTVSAGFNNPSFQWQQRLNGGAWTDIPGANNTSYTAVFPSNNPIGSYAYRLTAAEAGNLSSPQCRVVSKVLTIRVNANPVTATSSNSPVCEKDILQLNASGGENYQWTGPNSFTATTASVQLNNASPSQTGKYLVNVTNAAGCSHLDSVSIIVNPSPIATTSFPSVTICQGNNVQLTGTGAGTFQWSPATQLNSDQVPNPVAAPLDTITYSLIVTNQFSCKDTTEVTVNVMAKPTANAGPDQSIIKGTSIMLPATSSGQHLEYNWTPALFIDDPTILQPTVTPPRDTTYVLTVTSTDGCGTATDIVKVMVYKDIFVPTAFSPNNDGVNDTWSIPALAAYPAYNVSVFDRHGQLVFFLRNSLKPWNGKYKGVDLPVGTYVYMIDVKMKGQKLLKGTLTLFR